MHLDLFSEFYLVTVTTSETMATSKLDESLVQEEAEDFKNGQVDVNTHVKKNSCIWDLLPPEIIIEILVFCNKEDVVNFAEALASKIEDIWDVIANKRLWKDAVIAPENKYIKYLGSYTKTLRIESKNVAWTIPKKMVKLITSKCTALEKLTIANSHYYLSSAPLSMFPKTITHLKFVDVSIDFRSSTESHSRFRYLHGSLPKLECLELKSRGRRVVYQIYPIDGHNSNIIMNFGYEGDNCRRVIKYFHTNYKNMENLLYHEFSRNS